MTKGNKNSKPRGKSDQASATTEVADKWPMRLNRYLAHSGVCSRREADTLIDEGRVKVNGKVVKEMGFKVAQADDVLFDGKKLQPETLKYVLLNKPKGYITTTKDTHDRKTVLDLVARACDERIYPVGRLDRETLGLILITNDGDLAKKLTHPSHRVKKIYHVFLDRMVEEDDMDQMVAGVELEDGLMKADVVNYVSEQPNGTEVGIQIHSGKNRIVRRLFAHFGYKVMKLDRVLFAGLTKKDLPRGKWRHLTEREVGQLKMLK